MKKTFLNFLGGCMLLLSATAMQAQGLQGIIVEEFHTVTTADANFVNNTLGNGSYTLNPGSKVYRIFIDMAPGYRLVSIFASPAATFGGTDSPNPLVIQTTTNFWNDDFFGSAQPAQTRRVPSGTFFDSFITVGTTGTAGGAAGCGSSLAQLGVPRALDPNGDLTTCGVYPGFSGADGSYPGSAPALTTNLGGSINFAALTEDGSTFTFIDDVWSTLPSIQGFDPDGENIIFVGQFTTDGDFSFQINVAVGDPDNNLEEYVHSSPGFGQFQRDFLTFPQVGTPDCLGVIGGAAQPGSPCDDGLATTGNDVYDADCNCVGQLIDCLGVAGGSALPGTPCDDGNVSTANDLYGADCTCAGQLVDCLGVIGGPAVAGSPCDDGDATTGNDVYGADCTCAGQLIDCLGVAGGTALPGTPCNDGLATTGNDVYGADCTCAGQLIDCLGVAGGSALPGTPCDDGNPNSSNDVYGADCTCSGTLANDCLGVAGGSAQPGTPCDDGDATTGNDVYGADCTCAGQLIDCLGVAGGTALPGTPCNDGNPNSSNDVYGADCICAGILANDCLGVAGGSALPGTPCNDGDATTVGDTWTADCQCVGTPIGTECSFNELLLEIQTDGISQTTWEFVTSGTNVVVASGGSQYAAGMVMESVCLVDGCYNLRVFDDAGDGITNGGYILRNSAGDRIIDNRNNFTSGNLSAIGNGPSDFCVPIGTQNLTWLRRDKLDWVSGEYLQAEPDAVVSSFWVSGGANSVQSTNTGYQFWIFDPNGSYNYRRFRNHATSDNFGPPSAIRACYMKINNWALANRIPENVLMNVRVRTRVEGVNGNWGPASRMMIDPVRAQCPLTKLADTPNDAFLSCDQVRPFGPGNFVWARPVTGANLYQFRFRLPAEGFTRVVTNTTYVLQLNWTTGALEAGKTYDVDVRVRKGETWCTSGPLWGDNCTLTIMGASGMAEGRTKELVENPYSLSMWPNPNKGEQLWLDLVGIEAGVEAVAVDIFDMTGKRVVARMIPTQGDRLNTVLDIQGDLATGIYLVNITAGTQRYTERLVIAR